MKSELKEMLKKHREEIDTLLKNCTHKHLKIYKDHSVIGCGSAYPAIHIICKNCGKKKIMFVNGLTEYKTKIEKTLEKQDGIKDQRLNCRIQYEYELE